MQYWIYVSLKASSDNSNKTNPNFAILHILGKKGNRVTAGF